MSPRSVVVIGCALVGPLLFAGCGDSGAVVNSPPPPSGIQTYEPDAGDAGVPEETTEPSAPPLAAALPYQGNGLCQASRTSCYPDDVFNACDFPPGTVVADAGDAGVSFAPACHVVANGLSQGTRCLPSTVPGMVASTCAHPTECSPGYECVQGGTCRHYCCAGNSACSENQFCDVQPVADAPGTLVPVCLAQIPCILLKNEPCSPDEQCSVVRDDGATSCVTVGTAQDGQSCEEEHCASKLVCLGPLGARRCEPLCSTLTPGDCPIGRTCIGTLPLFPNPTVGVCQ